MAKIRVPRTGVTEGELADVLRRRLGPEFQVAGSHGSTPRPEVVVRRSLLTAVVVRINGVPGATVFRVRGVGMPVVSLVTAHAVADALRRSPEFRSI